MGIREDALRGIKPDRSGDVLPPGDPNTTEPCDCGKRMIGRFDSSNMHQGWMRWYWWCACGAVKDGGIYHPPILEEQIHDRWLRAQG